MSDLSPRARAILDAARAADRPARASSDAVRQALAAQLGPLAFGSPPAPGPIAGMGGGGAAASGAGILVKVIGAMAVLGATLTGGIFIGRATAPSQAGAPAAPSAEIDAPPSASAAVSAAPPPTTTTALVAPLPAQLAPPRASLPAARSREAQDRRAIAEDARLASRDAGAEITPTPPVEEGSLADEASLLREAHLSLRSGDAEASLRKLDELTSRHPHGLLLEERMALRIFALCAAGKPALARAEADRFLETSPRSPLSERVRASCAFAPEPAQKRE